MKRVLFMLLFAASAFAETDAITVLPPSRHHQYLTFGLFNEEGCSLLFRDAKRAWGGIGASIAFFEVSAWPTKPQLVLNGTVNVSFLEKAGPGDFLVETFDGRFGLAAEFTLSPEVRLSVGFVHISGHVADGTLDPVLIPPNLGDDAFVARVVWDPGGRFRLGATFKPLLGADPPSQALGFEQFAEWFPFGVHEGNGATWFLGGGLDEYGKDTLLVTWQVQAGIYVGSHVTAEKKTTVRAQIGYYDGWDPRLKYAQLRGSRVHFPYAGLVINL